MDASISPLWVGGMPVSNSSLLHIAEVLESPRLPRLSWCEWLMSACLRSGPPAGIPGEHSLGRGGCFWTCKPSLSASVFSVHCCRCGFPSVLSNGCSGTCVSRQCSLGVGADLLEVFLGKGSCGVKTGTFEMFYSTLFYPGRSHWDIKSCLPGSPGRDSRQVVKQ